MNNLADALLNQFFFLTFCSEDELEPDASIRQSGALLQQIERCFSPSEKVALQEAAKRSLASWLRDPDEHGYTPRTLLTDEQRAFLEAVAKGNFSGAPIDIDEV